MPIINKNRCYAQQEKREMPVPPNLANNWLTEFYELLAVQLNLNDTDKQSVFDSKTDTWVDLTEKEIFFKDFDKHVGPTSSYSLKPQLLESLRTLYCCFIDPKTTTTQKSMVALKIQEGIADCSPGFNDRVNFTIFLFYIPRNMDELLAAVRFSLVDQLANKVAQTNTQGVHVHTRFFAIAQLYGFGVWSINKDDLYLQTGSSDLSNQDIAKKLEEGFSAHYGLFGILNSMRDQIKTLLTRQGYNGRNEEEYKNKDREKFSELIKPFITINDDKLFEMTETLKTLDINWKNVNEALFKKFYEEGYVDLSAEEASLLASFPFSLDSTALNTLIPSGHELAECLIFFSDWTIEQKEALVMAYLKDKTLGEQEVALTILAKQAPQLTAQLKFQPYLQQLYFSIAIQKGDVAAVKIGVQQGADINAALSLLFSEPHKSDTLYWLHENKSLLTHITQDGMQALIPNGKYHGKTIAEALVNTKKGRQLLLENPSLQTLLPETIANRSCDDYLKQAASERSNANTLAGFFKKPNPLATQLGQYIVYGDLTKTEELLKANPLLLEKLLTEKITVTDYSRRKSKKKSAFQAALCAMDDEMCEMLAKYMSKDEIAHQYQDIFPEGHEQYFEAQAPFDFTDIVDAITSSNDADVQQALDLELPNNTVLWSKLEQFRVDFTEHSKAENVFNPQHLIKAFDLYDKKFDGWNWNQRDLFWRQVIGYTQRFLPANIAMVFAYSLYDVVGNQKKAPRSFKFRYSDGSFFPLTFDALSGLGFEHGPVGVGDRGRRRAGGMRRVKTYVKQKLQIFETYAAISKNENLRDSVR